MTKIELIHTAVYAGVFAVLFAFGEILYHWLKVPVEITRKFVHLGTGLICLTFPFFLETHWSVLILTIAFFVILLSSIKLNLLQSINAVDRSTRGSFLFPVVIYLTFWAYSIFGLKNPHGVGLGLRDFGDKTNLYYGGTIYYFLPILILSISDPIAALVGKRWPVMPYKIRSCQKTVMGSSAFFVSAFVLSFAFITPIIDQFIWAMIFASIIAFSATFVEAISQKGEDNLLIPLSVILMLILFDSQLNI